MRIYHSVLKIGFLFMDERDVYFRPRNPLYESCRRGIFHSCTEFIILRRK
jgi:hypothetical protein